MVCKVRVWCNVAVWFIGVVLDVRCRVLEKILSWEHAIKLKLWKCIARRPQTNPLNERFCVASGWTRTTSLPSQSLVVRMCLEQRHTNTMSGADEIVENEHPDEEVCVQIQN